MSHFLMAVKARVHERNAERQRRYAERDKKEGRHLSAAMYKWAAVRNENAAAAIRHKIK